MTFKMATKERTREVLGNGLIIFGMKPPASYKKNVERAKEKAEAEQASKPPAKAFNQIK